MRAPWWPSRKHCINAGWRRSRTRVSADVRSTRLVHVLFFFSGAAGLIDQVVWVRAFGNLFGNTVHSAALVTAIFMSGLGFGGWASGKLADRWGATSRRLVAAYGAAELGVAI